MSTVRWWTPDDIYQVSRTMDRLFDEFVGQGGASRPGSESGGNGLPTHTLPVDILETPAAYVLTASVPGFAPDQVEVTYADGLLTIAAQARPLEARGTWIRQERPFGSWYRRLQLPQQVQPDGITADFDNGLLTVTVPKLARPEPVRIAVAGQRTRSKTLKS
jgi:HSP20 family protein